MKGSLFLHKPENAQALLAELQRIYPRSSHRATGPGEILSELTSAEASRPMVVAFAQQALPQVAAVKAPSISSWSNEIVAALEPLMRHPEPWHLLLSSAAESKAGPRRMSLIRDGVRDILKRKNRTLLKLLRESDAGEEVERKALVQAHFTALDAGFVSALRSHEREAYDAVLSLYPAGQVHVPRDRRPPARAYQKLVEAQLRSGKFIQKGDRCVDLGCSPGSWSFIVLDRGAHAIGVDRAAPRRDILEHKRMEFVKGDAFTYLPKNRVDWLLSDIIAFPERIYELLDQWTKDRLCKRFVVTVKFRGSADYPKIDEFKRLVQERCSEFFVTSLISNKNEVTVYGEVG